LSGSKSRDTSSGLCGDVTDDTVCAKLLVSWAGARYKKNLLVEVELASVKLALEVDVKYCMMTNSHEKMD
jgi:hypothetical protein